MNIGGWIFMICSLGVVLSVTFWCYVKVMTTDDPVCEDIEEDVL